MRQHPTISQMVFKKTIKRAEQSNYTDVYVNRQVGLEMDEKKWKEAFEVAPKLLTEDDAKNWIKEMNGVALSSDAFFPFRDNIDRAAMSGVTYVASPGGSTNDQVVVDACNDHGMVLVHTGLRLFHH